MKKKKALKRLEAAILEVDRLSEHNTELRRTQIQLTRRLEDGQAWANAASSRIRDLETGNNNQEIGLKELQGRIDTLNSMNEEAGRLLRERTQALQVANETIRRRDQVISLYADKFGAGPADAAPAADDAGGEDLPVITISFRLIGIGEDGEKTEIGRFEKTFSVGGADDRTDDDDDRTDDGADGPGWQHCGDPGCVICNAADEMLNGDGAPGAAGVDSFVKMSEQARQEQRKKVFAELGEVLDQAARFLNRPFTNGKGVQSWELRGRLANLQIEFAELNANDRGMEEDPPAYRALRGKIIDFARGVKDLTGEDFGDALTPARAIADGADPDVVPGGRRLWEMLQTAMRDGGPPAPSKLRDLVEMTAQTNTIPAEEQEKAAAEWWKNNGGGIEGLRGRVAAFRAALEAERPRTVEELAERARNGQLSGSLMSEVIGGAISRAAQAAAESSQVEPMRQRMRREIFEKMRELNRQEEAPDVEELRPAGALAVHVHETVNAAGVRILEVENIRAGSSKRFYIMMNAAGVPELVPVGDLD